ncbi:RICIN domain-containing protein [Dactylosporangium sp. CA-092794]|uniref:RICIN domain-containing protein n=1 Tax=Dactylosporangium sp. CA-092794 TaxID=3239929 RepID=UPI003D916415
MTVYGGPRPTPPAPKPDRVLLAAAGFLVLAVVVGIVFGVQAFTSDASKATSAPAGPPPSAAAPSDGPPSVAPSSAAPPPPSPTPSPTPTQATAALLAARPTLMRPDHSGLCLQANPGNGGNANQVPCDGNNATMLWVPQLITGTQDVFRFVNAADNRCLDVNGASKDNGAQILIWDCNGGANQVWRLVRDGDGYRLLSLNSNKCIGIDNGNPAPGAVARQWDCDGSTNQRWQFQQL